MRKKNFIILGTFVILFSLMNRSKNKQIKKSTASKAPASINRVKRNSTDRSMASLKQPLEEKKIKIKSETKSVKTLSSILKKYNAIKRPIRINDQVLYPTKTSSTSRQKTNRIDDRNFFIDKETWQPTQITGKIFINYKAINLSELLNYLKDQGHRIGVNYESISTLEVIVKNRANTREYVRDLNRNYPRAKSQTELSSAEYIPL
jgi:hypothetical protein